MVKSQDIGIEERLSAFHAQFAESLQALIAALNTARISHYSSGCGNKSVTFDIFPASTYVAELLRMVSLNRAYKAKPHQGFRDASRKDSYNPAREFLQYLRRWSHFAEQVMQHEGASLRGVAAAQAKLIMTDLMANLNLNTVPAKSQSGRFSNLPIPTDFSRLMADIGLALEVEAQKEKEEEKVFHKKASEHNYFKALAVAQGMLADESEQATA
jgi:hypothetical protein